MNILNKIKKQKRKRFIPLRKRRIFRIIHKIMLRKVLPPNFPKKIVTQPQQFFSTLPQNWVKLPFKSTTEPPPQPFRILSYNILAESNMTEDLFIDHDPKHLEWKLRQKLLFEYRFLRFPLIFLEISPISDQMSPACKSSK
jgi:mRNA deadenylase, exonuclease subunit and related nucleases